MVILLLIIGVIGFIWYGMGFFMLNLIALGLIEVVGILFSGVIGFVVLGLIISWTLASTHKQ